MSTKKNVKASDDSGDSDRIAIRLSPKLKQQAIVAAKKEGRSLNNWLKWLITQHVEGK